MHFLLKHTIMIILRKLTLSVYAIGLLCLTFQACNEENEENAPIISAASRTDGNTTDEEDENGGGSGDNTEIPKLTFNSPETVEGDVMKFEFELSKSSENEVTLIASTDNIVAQNGLDYTGFASKVIKFLPGSTSATLEVITREDNVKEIDEKFRLNIEQLEGASSEVKFSIATILDND